MKQFYLFGILLLRIFFLEAQDDFELSKETLSSENIKSHIYFLASDELRGRETGSHGGNIAALYLSNQLRKFGVKDVPGTDRPYFQNIPLKELTPPQDKLLEVGELAIDNLLWIKGDNIDKKASATYVDFGLEGDYEGKDVKNSWVIAKGGSSEDSGLQASISVTAQKRELAKQAGAIGLIEVSEASERAWRYLSFNLNRKKMGMDSLDPFPHIWIKSDDFDLDSFENESQVRLMLGGIKEEKLITQNVVGMVEGTDSVLKDQFVIYSAHYDHVGVGRPDKNQDSVYNGARDNAVGAVTVLSMAENLAKYPTKRSALFIFFTGEEKGLIGSNYYVEYPLLPLNQMVFCFNSDNGGYNDTTLATIVGLNRTTTAPLIKRAARLAGLTATDDPAPEQNLFDRSDNVKFAVKGIPAPTYSLGFTAFDKEINRFYHRPGDQANNLNYNYLYKFFLSYVLSGRYIGNDPKTPFWSQGDKYYEAGRKLYE